MTSSHFITLRSTRDDVISFYQAGLADAPLTKRQRTGLKWCLNISPAWKRWSLHQQPACLTLLASCTSTRCSTKSSLSVLALQQCWRPSQHCCRSTRAWRHTPSRKRSLRERRTWECSANTFRLRIPNRSKRPMHLQRCSLASPLLHCRQ